MNRWWKGARLCAEVAVTDDTKNTKTLFIAMIAPRGWYYQNIIAYDRFVQETVFPLVDPVTRRVYPNRGTDTEAAPARQLPKNTPYNILAGFLAGMTADPGRSLVKFGRSQNLADQAAVACALERFWLTNWRLVLGVLVRGRLSSKTARNLRKASRKSPSN